MKKINFEVNEQKRELFKKMAKMNNRSSSGLLREFIDDYIENNKKRYIEETQPTLIN